MRHNFIILFRNVERERLKRQRKIYIITTKQNQRPSLSQMGKERSVSISLQSPSLKMIYSKIHVIHFHQKLFVFIESQPQNNVLNKKYNKSTVNLLNFDRDDFSTPRDNFAEETKTIDLHRLVFRGDIDTIERYFEKGLIGPEDFEKFDHRGNNPLHLGIVFQLA